LFWYALLTLALAGMYAISGALGVTQRVVKFGTASLIPVFLIGNGLILGIALTLWGRTLLYFCLFALNSYGALVHYTGKRKWALVFAIGLVVFSWLVYAWQRGRSSAWPALSSDLPWFGLTFALAEIVARQREHREQAEKLAAELAEAHRQLQDYATQAEELAVTRERARLAHEIHDTVGHALTALDVQLELLARLPPGHSEQRQQIASQSRSLVKDGLADLRRAVRALRPAALESFPLPDAISTLVSDFEQTTNIQTTWKVGGEAAALPSRLAAPLYRAAQEALTNIRKHAPEAQQATIQLQYGQEAVVLTITNDGANFNPNPLAGNSRIMGGYGLQGLRERAEQLGGKFLAISDETGNFTLEIQLPLH
ncbi:MAG: sensor histidine kinase, partial [Anaerolineales bacterium]|nr:sensor histidine kinase [Anaerolineales bacterium]